MTEFDFKNLRKDKDAYLARFRETDRMGQLVGARCVSLDSEACEFAYDVSPGHFNPNGILHGGALFTVMDSSQGLFMHFILDEGFRFAVTGTATVRYAKPVNAGEVRVRTVLDRHEGRKLFVRSEATQDSETVATLEETWIAVP